MCASCGCCRADDDHQDARALTLADLNDAAKQAGCDVPMVVANIVRTLAGCTPASKEIVAAETDLAACRVVKTAEERRYTLGVAYPANKADVRRAADGHIDFVSPEVLEKTAWEWMSKHRDINLFHADSTSGHGVVVESYIYRGPDWEINSPVDGGAYVVKAGDWLLGSQWDDYGWDLVKAGLVNGWSPEGGARRDLTPSTQRLAQLRKR